LRKETTVGEHGSHLHSYHCRFLFRKQNSDNWKLDCAGYGDGSSSAAAAEERQPEAQARLGIIFLLKYYFSVINFWEINFTVSGD
jgi:hypothetical protein